MPHPLVQSGSCLKQAALGKPWTRGRGRKRKKKQQKQTTKTNPAADNGSCSETARKAANTPARNITVPNCLWPAVGLVPLHVPLNMLWPGSPLPSVTLHMTLKETSRHCQLKTQCSLCSITGDTLPPPSMASPVQVSDCAVWTIVCSPPPHQKGPGARVE